MLMITAFSTAIFQKLGKNLSFYPVPKISNPSSVRDLRPINLLPVISKILEGAVYNQLFEYLTIHKILPLFNNLDYANKITIFFVLCITDLLFL